MKTAVPAALLWLCTTGCELLVNDGTRSLAPADASGQEASFGENVPIPQTDFASVDAANIDAGEDAAFVGPPGVIAVDGASELPTADATAVADANALEPDAKADVPDAVDAAPEDAFTGTVDAPSCSTNRQSVCIDRTVSCAQGCAGNGMACVSQCSNHGCEKGCPQQVMDCRAACRQTCASCLAAIGCSMTDTSACSMAASPQN